MSVLTRPYDYQLEDVRHVYRDFGGRGGLFWDPGLGKSFGAFLSAYRYGLGKTTIIICPASVKETWRREAKKHLGVRALVLHGRTPPEVFRPRPGTYVIANYDILGLPFGRRPSWAKTLLTLDADLLVLDEGQYCKNMGSQRTQSCMELARAAPHLLVLTGTPILNRPIEMFPLLHMINPQEWDSEFDYGAKYCAMYRDEHYQWNKSGASNLPELHERVLRTSACRRRREDVMSQLPSKTRTVLPMDLPPKARRDYDTLVADFARWYRKRFRKNMAGRDRFRFVSDGLAKLGYMKRAAAAGILPGLKEWITDFLDSSGRKLLVCGIHHAVLRPLAKHFGRRAVLVNGSMTGRVRQAAFDRFNTDPSCVLLFGNIDAAGVGWSCSGADDVLKAEVDWVPGKHIQFEDRCLGIGRGTGTGRPVGVYYAVARNTVTEKVCEVVQRKIAIVQTVMDGGPSGELKLFDELAASVRAMAKKKGV